MIDQRSHPLPVKVVYVSVAHRFFNKWVEALFFKNSINFGVIGFLCKEKLNRLQVAIKKGQHWLLALLKTLEGWLDPLRNFLRRLHQLKPTQSTYHNFFMVKKLHDFFISAHHLLADFVDPELKGYFGHCKMIIIYFFLKTNFKFRL